MAGNPKLQSSTFARKFRTFLRWMRNNGIDYTDGLAFELGGNGSVADIGVKAVYAMETNELIATIPKQACLTVKTTAAAKLIDDEKIGGGLGLAVALMYERALQQGSRWYGYLQLLPLEQKLPFLWSPTEIDSLLLGTELHKVITEDVFLMEEDWKESIAPLSLHHVAHFPANWFTLEHYFTAKALVASRAFEVDEYHGYGMVPLADLFNHKTAAEDVHFTSVESDSDSESNADPDSDAHKCPEISQGNNHVKAGKILKKSLVEERHQSESCEEVAESSDVSSSAWEGNSELLEMILVKDVAGGAEIFNTYGTLSNAALLHRYGFTELDNPFDLVNIDLTAVLDISLKSFTSRHVRRRTAHWRKLGCAPCISQDCEYFEISALGKPQEDLLMLLYLMHLSDEAFDKLASVGSLIDRGLESTARALGWAAGGPPEPEKGGGVVAQSKKRSRHSQPVVKQEVELGSWLLSEPVCRTMLQLLEQRDGLYPTSSLDEDLAQLNTCDRNEQPRQFHALVLRSSERSILKRCHAVLLQRLATVKRQPFGNN